MGIEQKINQKLNRYPKIKKQIKSIYQHAMYIISPKIKSEGNIFCVSPDDPKHEYFFGYYDKSPWDFSDRYMLCLKANNTWSEAAPKESAKILIIDTQHNNKSYEIAETHSWNVQQGCMLQWLGPEYKNKIIYNDFRNNKYCSVILTLEMNENDIKIIKEDVFEMPIYTVSQDGKFALTLDFSRLHRLRPGYGYSNKEEITKNEKLPDETCIWRVDLISGDIIPLLKYTDFSNFEPRIEMKGAEHKVNHLMLNQNGKRFMVLHRWFAGQHKYSRLITCDVDGTNMYNLSDDDMVSHCCWKNENEILAFENKKHSGVGYYLMKDKTKQYQKYWDGIDFDGHPSYSPDKNMVVFDRYPDKSRVASIMISNANNIEKDNVRTIAKVFAPFKYDNNTRCDLHPRWNRKGNKICFDSIFEGHRGLYCIDFQKEYSNKEKLNQIKGLVSVIIPTYKRSNTLKRAIDSVLKQSYSDIEILVVDDNQLGTPDSDFVKKIVNSYNINKVKYIGQTKHINGAVARNVGIKKSKGEFISFLDDDDEWKPNKLIEQVNYLNLNREMDGVSCLYDVYKNAVEIRKCKPYEGKMLHKKVLLREVAVFTSTILLRKNALDETNYFNESLIRHQDLQLLLDFLYTHEMGVINQHLVILHSDSNLNHPDIEKLEKIKKQFFKICAKHFESYNKRDQKRFYCAHYFEIIVQALKSKKYKKALKYLFIIGPNFQAYQDVYNRMKNR